MTNRFAPSPPGKWFTGHLASIRHDVLGLLVSSTREYGDVVRFRLGTLPVHLLNHPDYFAHVLLKNRENYDKNSRSSQSLRLVCGESLLTASGEAWHWRRKLVQPAFHHEAVEGMVTTMIVSTSEMLDEWSRRSQAGESVEIASAMMQLTCRIIGRCLFGTNLTLELSTIEDAMRTIVAYTYRRWRRLINWPASWRVGDNRVFHQSRVEVDAVVRQLLARHRANPPQTPNLLTMLSEGIDQETGLPVSENQIRQEALVFLLAGHETTANALAWSFYLLTKHPVEAEKIREEIETVCGSRAPEMRDLPRLEHTTRVFQETIRLYPPIWAMERHANDDDCIAGYHIPKNSSIILSTYTLHRHPEFWSAPDAFLPERFMEKENPAYLPFGAGPRHCIGDEFAASEAKIILAMVLQRFEIEAVEGKTIIPEAGLTLRLHSPLHLRLRERKNR